MNTPDVINALERNGRIQELDTIVFQKVVQHRLILNERLPGNDLFLSVNASALSLNETFVNTIIEMFVQSGLPQGSIVLELTESYKVEDYEYLIRLFQRLDHAGIRTAIDDFGSGYSSLSYVSRFPVYSIKLDKTYVREYQQNRFNRTLFLTVRSISQVLGAKLVAEGVDDPDTLDFLRHNRCEFYQGFLLSPGVPFEDAVRMYEDHNTKKE
jgi:EAL domain-containing protein (putative c-di-GMP-specific phosphodiesterase class I)